MKTFEIFYNNGICDSEDFKFTEQADSIDHLCRKLAIDDYNACEYESGIYYLNHTYREEELKNMFCLDEDDIEYINDHKETGYIVARQLIEENHGTTDSE